jgi:acyl-CoA thioesterase-2
MPPTDELSRVLDLDPIELDMFHGYTSPERHHRIFGGQVIGQALTAAYHSIEGRVCNSLHAYFIRPGNPEIPILFQVERARDGGSFSIRRVVAVQRGQQILNLAASFQAPEEGLEHEIAMPDVPPPEGLLNEGQLREAAGQPTETGLANEPSPAEPSPIEMRPVNPRPPGPAAPVDPVAKSWFRAAALYRDTVAAHQAILAYASDLTLLGASLRPHPFDWNEERMQMASLDHVIWFHRQSNFMDWHLYVQDSPSASGGRGFNRASIFARDGRLVASVAQEGLIRLRPTKTGGA